MNRFSASQSRLRRPLWRISDLLDLDFFISRSEDQSGAADRAIYLSYAKTSTPPFDRKELIRYWLDEKRAAFPDNRLLPGAVFHETMALLKLVAAAAAFIFGAILAWSILSYSGKAPINIFTCLWVMVVPQLLLLLLLGVSALWSRPGAPNAFRGFYPVASLLLRRLSDRVKTAGQNSLSAETRLRVDTLLNLTGRQKALYYPVFFWPLFILAQLFGVWFNLGLLAAAGLKLAIADLAFGWQSTLFPDPATVHRLVELFSRPWSWAVTAAHPSLAQIEGSRIILKEGLTHLATPDLVSWWPFLLCSILCYGFIPRLALLAWGGWRQQRTIGAAGFSTGDCDRLIQRLRTPRLQSTGQDENAPAPRKNWFTPPDPEAGLPGSFVPEPMGAAVILIPEEIAHLFPDDAIKDRLAAVLGLNITTRLLVDQNPETDLPALNDLLSRQAAPREKLRLVALTEAWQPPLGETVAWLAGLRRTAGPRTGLIVALVGKPEAGNRFTAPTAMELKSWEGAVASLKDPFARVEILGGAHG